MSRLATILVACALLMGCAPRHRDPDYCLLVATPEAEMEALLLLFDEFAESESLNAQSGVSVRNYVPGDRSFDLSVVTHLGPLGSNVAFYQRTETRDDEFEARLTAFVQQRIAERWQVQMCADVLDFETRAYP